VAGRDDSRRALRRRAEEGRCPLRGGLQTLGQDGPGRRDRASAGLSGARRHRGAVRVPRRQLRYLRSGGPGRDDHPSRVGPVRRPAGGREENAGLRGARTRKFDPGPLMLEPRRAVRSWDVRGAWMEAAAAVLAFLLQVAMITSVLALGLKARAADVLYLWHRPGLLLRSFLAMYFVTPLI